MGGAIYDVIDGKLKFAKKYATYKTHYFCSVCRVWFPQKIYKNKKKTYQCPLCHRQLRRSPRHKFHELPRVKLDDLEEYAGDDSAPSGRAGKT